MKRFADFAETILHQFLATGLPVRLHLRSELHLARKVWHMFMGLVISLVYLAGMHATTAVLILSVFLAFDLGMELARLRIPSFNEKCIRFWGPVMRSCEVNKMSGIPAYILAAILAIGIFPQPVAILSILFLAFGDPIASLVGILYGDRSVRFASGKSLIGTLGGMAACTVVSLIFLRAFALPDFAYLGISLIGGIAGGAAELIPLDTDDNFTIPVVSGFILWFAFILFGV